MGLDVTAYRKVKLVGRADMDTWNGEYDWDTTGHIWPGYFGDYDFAEWAEGLEPDGVYEFEESFGFRAGSCSGYNEWRRWLCQLALGISPSVVWNNEEKYKHEPFFRLINFSDCEGYISSKWARGLADDFAGFQSVVDESDVGVSYKNKYADWRKAFEMAADDGYVDFH